MWENLDDSVAFHSPRFSNPLTFLAFSSSLTVMLPVPGPTSRTTSVGLRAAWKTSRHKFSFMNTSVHLCVHGNSTVRSFLFINRRRHAAYLLDDPIDNQRVLQDVLANAGVEHDPWNTDLHTMYSDFIMLRSFKIFNHSITNKSTHEIQLSYLYTHTPLYVCNIYTLPDFN